LKKGKNTMPKLTFKNGLPPPEEFREALSRAISEANPLDDLLMLSHDLSAYEEKYGMPSEEFYAKYQAGVLDDELQHCMEWVSAYKLFMKIRHRLESALIRTALYPEPENIAA
jgi:hypothetical protein